MAAVGLAPYEYHLVFGAHPDEPHFAGPRARAPHVARVFVDRNLPYEPLPPGIHHDLFVQHDFNDTWSLPGAILEAIEKNVKDYRTAAALRGITGTSAATPWTALLASFSSPPSLEKRKEIPFLVPFFHKMYFDISVTKFLEWGTYTMDPPNKHPYSLMNVFGLLRPGASLYMPEFAPLPAPSSRTLICPEIKYPDGYLRSVIDQLPLSDATETGRILRGSSIPYMHNDYPRRWEDTRAYIPSDLPRQLLERQFNHSRKPAPIIALDFHSDYPALNTVPDPHAYPDIGLRDRVQANQLPRKFLDDFQFAHITLFGWHQAGTPLPDLP